MGIAKSRDEQPKAYLTLALSQKQRGQKSGSLLPKEKRTSKTIQQIFVLSPTIV
jgi:hypothetical protein